MLCKSWGGGGGGGAPPGEYSMDSQRNLLKSFEAS